MALWSDGKTNEDIQKLAESNSNSVVYNLHEDLLCVKEDLAKANERVKELEKINLELAANVEACCELTDMDMGAAIDRLFEIDNTESKALLNKFALEKKIEALRKFEPISNAVANHWCDKEQKGYLWLHAEILAEIERLKQLRKEQE